MGIVILISDLSLNKMYRMYSCQKLGSLEPLSQNVSIDVRQSSFACRAHPETWIGQSDETDEYYSCSSTKFSTSVAYHGLRVVRDVNRCTVSLLMIIFCITYRYIAVRVLQSTVDTTEEIWYQFILEACARKYQPNKELREKHGVLEISLLAEKVCTI